MRKIDMSNVFTLSKVSREVIDLELKVITCHYLPTGMQVQYWGEY